MSLCVDLILESERRSASLVSLRFALRTVIALAAGLFWAAWEFLLLS